jgi:hypothetical protein
MLIKNEQRQNQLKRKEKREAYKKLKRSLKKAMNTNSLEKDKLGNPNKKVKLEERSPEKSNLADIVLEKLDNPISTLPMDKKSTLPLKSEQKP